MIHRFLSVPFLTGRRKNRTINLLTNSLNGLIEAQFVAGRRRTNKEILQDFLINHISGSFVEMVLWWIRGQMRQSPEMLDEYFRAVIEPIL